MDISSLTLATLVGITKNAKCKMQNVGASQGTRTLDLLITSELLYQLS
jgi:hypothetical protein